MLFDTLPYWLFFVAFLVVYRFLAARWKAASLALASYLFYAAWDWRFVLLLLVSSLLNFYLGLAIDRCNVKEARRSARRWLIGAIAVNLSILGFFKYANFFIDSFATLFGIDPQGLLLNIILPVGISFYTFEGIAYCSDVYHGSVKAERNPTHFCVFMSFFPHLAAGPVIRPSAFFPQLRVTGEVAESDLRWGLLQIVKGLIKKMVFADALAPFADAFFGGQPLDGMAVPAWIGVLCFGMQIYFDFAGYTDIARGCARLLGFSFPSNFERPYLASDIAEFWRRWHISLSTWLRDYLYIPLGGNRHGVVRTYCNLIAVMTLGGLWHGASWNFALWGLYQGVVLCAHRAVVTSGIVPHIFPARIWSVFSVGLTFAVVMIGWIPFRARDLPATIDILTRLPGSLSWASFIDWRGPLLAMLSAWLFCAADRERRLQRWLVRSASRPAAMLSLGVSWWLLSVFANTEADVPFIYFQF